MGQTALVDPPRTVINTIAFKKEARVRMSLSLDVSRSSRRKPNLTLALYLARVVV
jgi:hypothetical protein